MVEFYEFDRIDIGKDKRQHGHVVHTDAQYLQDDGTLKPIILKLNKNDDAELTRFEVAFGELARLFLLPNLTPKQQLVRDKNGNVVGLGCDHLFTAINDYEDAHNPGRPKLFYKCDANGDFQPVVPGDKKNYFFLEEFPAGFFANLFHKEKLGKLSIDHESLAAVLAGSYTLEEDDLHKGNIGFYAVHKHDGKPPHLVFFKIDHDLMLAESVMSQFQSRFFNWFNIEGSFDVTKRDLLNFPRLRDSKNYYWPTAGRFFVAWNKKAYGNDADIRAFSDLSKSPAFCERKWDMFYKHVLIPPELIKQLLKKHFDETKPEEQARITLVTQAMVARQAKLRAVLFTIPEFREHVHKKYGKPEAQEAMLETIFSTVQPEVDEAYKKEVVANMNFHQHLCDPSPDNKYGFHKDDTPLHAAIRLQDYRYQETWQSFGHYANQNYKEGHQSPLNLAVSLSKIPPLMPPANGDPRNDLKRTMKHMLRSGARITESFREINREGDLPTRPVDYLYSSDYLDKADKVETGKELKSLLRSLGEDYRYSLKMQKELAVICVRRFINNNIKVEDKLAENPVGLKKHKENIKHILKDLKVQITDSHELQYIRQLRSHLWIVRKARGLLGGTATQLQLDNVLDKELKRLTPPRPSSCGLFSTKKRGPKDDGGVAPKLRIN